MAIKIMPPGYTIACCRESGKRRLGWKRMTLDTAEQWARWIGAVDALATLAVVLYGLARSLTRPRGRATGRANQMLRLPTYILISIGYFGLWYILWRPIPLALSIPARVTVLIL